MDGGITQFVQLWHLLLGGIPVLAFFLGYDYRYLRPIREWRARVDLWRAETNKDVEHLQKEVQDAKANHVTLDQKMDDVIGRLAVIETQLALLVKQNGGHK